jgi:hypothetical protein
MIFDFMKIHISRLTRRFALPALILTAAAALGANYDLRYLQENASGKIVERTVTLTPSTFLSVTANGTLQVQASSDFRTSLGLGSAATSNSTAFVASSNGTATNLTVTGTFTASNATLTGNATLPAGVKIRNISDFSLLGQGLAVFVGNTDVLPIRLYTIGNGTEALSYNGTVWTLANPTAFRSALALGSLATQNGTFSGSSSGNNTGDQTLAGLGGVASTNGTATNLTVNGTLTANGSALTGLNGTQVISGTVPAARLPNITLNLSGTLHNTPVNFTAGVGNATLANQTANTIFAGPVSGNATTPTFRALTNADIPSSLALSGNISNNGTATFGDAAADDFVATDDDPRFPNLTAATYTAAADNKVALNGDVGDARYNTVYQLFRPTSGVAIRLNVPQWSAVTAAGGTVGTDAIRTIAASSTSNSTAFAWGYTPYNNGSNQFLFPSGVTTGARFLLVMGSGSTASLNGVKFGFGGILNSDTLIPWGSMNVRGACVEWQLDMATGNTRMRLIVENAAGTENLGAWQTVGGAGSVFEFFLWVRDGTAHLRARRWPSGISTSLSWGVNTSLSGAPADTASFTTPSIWYGAVNHSAAANSIAVSCYDVTVFQITDDLSGL